MKNIQEDWENLRGLEMKDCLLQVIVIPLDVTVTSGNLWQDRVSVSKETVVNVVIN